MFGMYGQPDFNPQFYPSYQNNMPAYNQQPMQPMQQNYRAVNGIEEAKSYILPYGTSMILMDSEKPLFYLKEIDNQGVATITTYEFREVPSTPEPQYVTKSEFNELKQMIANLGGNNESVTSTPTATAAASTDAESADIW